MTKKSLKISQLYMFNLCYGIILIYTPYIKLLYLWGNFDPNMLGSTILYMQAKVHVSVFYFYFFSFLIAILAFPIMSKDAKNQRSEVRQQEAKSKN